MGVVVGGGKHGEVIFIYLFKKKKIQGELK